MADLKIHVRPSPAEATHFIINERFPHAFNECSECRHVQRTWQAFVRAMEE